MRHGGCLGGKEPTLPARGPCSPSPSLFPGLLPMWQWHPWQGSCIADLCPVSIAVLLGKEAPPAPRIPEEEGTCWASQLTSLHGSLSEQLVNGYWAGAARNGKMLRELEWGDKPRPPACIPALGALGDVSCWGGPCCVADATCSSAFFVDPHQFAATPCWAASVHAINGRFSCTVMKVLELVVVLASVASCWTSLPSAPWGGAAINHRR